MSVEVTAPMPGTILKVLVEVGDQVKEDEEV
ncbi:MAG: acetyl-CoA carboxylase biotin carboxyl carrier protein subunit, partial [Syntrophobacterales bacterium CG_4_9_14_3_um_filter_49_8]